MKFSPIIEFFRPNHSLKAPVVRPCTAVFLFLSAFLTVAFSLPHSCILADSIWEPEDPSAITGGSEEAEDYSSIRSQAEELEEKYQIQIFFGPDVPSAIDCYFNVPELRACVLSGAMDCFSSIISCYPENFFSQLCPDTEETICFYLTGDLYGTDPEVISDPGAYVSEADNQLSLVLDCQYTEDWPYMISHEISHLIDAHLEELASSDPELLYSETAWSLLNPADFFYLDSYAGYESNPAYGQYATYFCDAYGTTFSTEDRAELFGIAMEEYKDGYRYEDYFPDADSPRSRKLAWYCACIRDGFDTSGWPEILPWEEYLY